MRRTPLFAPSRFFSSRLRAFTLIELMVVVAIISVLAAVALPAYNNYSLKSKFSEVVLATAPTKTAISACAVAGDCVANGALTLAAPGGAGNSNDYAVSTTAPMSPALTYAAMYATLLDFGYAPATAASVSSSYANNAAAGTSYYLISATSVGQPTKVCVSTVTYSCTFTAAPPADVQAQLNAGTDPFFNSSTSTALSFPCVGASGCAPATKYVASVSYDATGVITATAQTSSGLKGETFMLTPSYSGGRIDWSASGSCKTRSGGALC